MIEKLRISNGKLNGAKNNLLQKVREEKIPSAIVLVLFLSISISLVVSFLALGIVDQAPFILFILLFLIIVTFIFTGVLIVLFIDRIRKLHKALAATKGSEIRELSYMDDVSKALLKSVDAKDSYTYKHSQRVAYYSKLLAKSAGISPEETDRIFIAAELHDIGKIGMRDSILNKPEKLSDSEYVTAKDHVIVGARIVSNLEYMKDIVPAIKYHHERYDGQGYPEGLKGEEIPLGARIIAICDSFDAMTSDREYHKGIEVDVAVGFLMNNIGTQYDPDLCILFADLLSVRSNLHPDIAKD